MPDGPFWGWLSVGDLVATNHITLFTEIIAIRVGMGFFDIPPQSPSDATSRSSP